MKKRINLLAVCMLAVCGAFVISCNQDEDYDEDFHDLDVIRYTTVAKTAQFEPGGAIQTIGNNNPVPVLDDECMMYSLITIAINKNTSIKYRINNEDVTGVINESISAATAYKRVKEVGKSLCDYNGGGMSGTNAAAIGQKTGILEGKVEEFTNFNDLQKRIINDPEFKKNHPDGTYIINNVGVHAVVGDGVSKKGNIKYIDAANRYGDTYKTESQTGKWQLIY